MSSLTFDDLLSERIGFGGYQIQTLLIVGFIDFMDGAENMLSMLLPPLLEKEWNLSNKQLEFFGSIFFIGQFVGSFLAGILSDKFGRKYTMAMGNFLEFLAFLWTAYVTEFYEMMILRFSYGCVLGITLPISVLMLTEQTPKSVRGRITIILQFFLLLGKIYLLLLASIYLQDLSTGDWRSMALANAIPCFLMFLGNIFLIDESARYLIIDNKIQEGIAILNHMITVNKRKDQIIANISQEEYQAMMIWRQHYFKESYSNWERFEGMFEGKALPITWRLFLLGSISHFVGAGNYFITPFLFQELNKGLFQIFLIVLAELPAIILIYFLIDMPTLGRKKMLLFGLASITVSLFIIYVGQQQTLLFGMILLKFFFRLTILIFIPLVAESYSTVLRAMALGVGGSLQRMSSAAAPFIVFEIFQYDIYLPYLFFTICLACCFIIMISYPIDKTCQSLDDRDVVESIKNKSIDGEEQERLAYGSNDNNFQFEYNQHQEEQEKKNGLSQEENPNTQSNNFSNTTNTNYNNKENIADNQQKQY